MVSFNGVNNKSGVSELAEIKWSAEPIKAKIATKCA